MADKPKVGVTQRLARMSGDRAVQVILNGPGTKAQKVAKVADVAKDSRVKHVATQAVKRGKG